MHKLVIHLSCFLLICMIASCKKETVFSDNPIPPNPTVSTLLVEQYVNRCFVDLLGRGATGEELAQFVSALESDNFSITSRKSFISNLQNGDDFKQQYLNKVYVDMKARYLDGLNEDEIQQEANFWLTQALQAQVLGDALAYNVLMQEHSKIMSLLNMALYWENTSIDYATNAKSMMFNSLYDDLNMGTFNFVHATFDQNFYRYPTDEEYNQLYAPIEYNGPGIFFQQNVTNKSEMLDIMVNSTEFKEGLVRWFYRSYFIREPDAEERTEGMAFWTTHNDFNGFIQHILSDDEYAGITQ
ncbi:MAG: hypothetical protein ACK478_06055 [Flavobacteriales bacterium]|jgi:hypothetical protein